MKKVLIIENEYRSIKPAIHVLVGKYREEQEDLDVDVCVKSQDVKWGEINTYNAILVDLSLAAKSEMDGYAILNLIKSNYPALVSRTAIITGNGMVEEALKSKGIGIEEFKVFTKPLKYMLLKAFVDLASSAIAETQEDTMDGME